MASLSQKSNLTGYLKIETVLLDKRFPPKSVARPGAFKASCLYMVLPIEEVSNTADQKTCKTLKKVLTGSYGGPITRLHRRGLVTVCCHVSLGTGCFLLGGSVLFDRVNRMEGMRGRRRLFAVASGFGI